MLIQPIYLTPETKGKLGFNEPLLIYWQGSLKPLVRIRYPRFCFSFLFRKVTSNSKCENQDHPHATKSIGWGLAFIVCIPPPPTPIDNFATFYYFDFSSRVRRHLQYPLIVVVTELLFLLLKSEELRFRPRKVSEVVPRCLREEGMDKNEC